MNAEGKKPAAGLSWEVTEGDEEGALLDEMLVQGQVRRRAFTDGY